MVYPIKPIRVKPIRGKKSSTKRHQKGTALLAVFLIFSICAVIAAEMQYRQHLDIRRTTNIFAQDQALMYIAAAEEIAFTVLQEDLKNDKKKGKEKDHLKEDWHSEKTFPIEGGAVTASLADMQGKFNVNSLEASDPAVADEAKKIFKELMSTVGIPKDTEEGLPPADLLAIILNWMDENDQEDGAIVESEDYYYQGLEEPYRTANTYLTDITEMRLIRGFSDFDIAELAPYITFLPPDTSLNVNTVDETIAGLLMTDGVTKIVTERPKKGWDKKEDIKMPQAGKKTQAKSDGTKDEDEEPAPQQQGIRMPYEVYSEYFLLTATVTINERTITNKSVIYRPREPDQNNPIRVIMRDRSRQFQFPKKEEEPALE